MKSNPDSVGGAFTMPFPARSTTHVGGGHFYHHEHFTEGPPRPPTPRLKRQPLTIPIRPPPLRRAALRFLDNESDHVTTPNLGFLVIKYALGSTSANSAISAKP